MSRVKTSLDHKRIRRLVWLVLTVFVLLGYSLQCAAGSAYYSMLMEPNTTVSPPPVILQNGTAGTSIIYANKTSAKTSVEAPLFDYVDNNDSDVDSSADRGMHSNFTAQQAGPDSIYDTLTEEDTGVGVVVEDYVDQTSNVDGVADLGSHDVFADLQASDDTYDNITEAGESGGAIAKVSTDTFTSGNSMASLSWSHTLVSGSNRLVVVGIGIENGNTTSISSVTYGGETMTEGETALTGTSGFRYIASIYYILEADLPTDGSKTVEVICSGNETEFEIWAICAQYTGVNQSAPEATDETVQTLGATISNTISPSTDAWVLSIVGAGNVGDWAHGQGQVEVVEFDDASSSSAFAELRGADGETSVDSTFTGTVNRLARVACSFAEAGTTDFQMDLEVQFTDVMDFMAVEYVCIETGTFYGSEDINVTYWTGSVWSSLASDMTASTWNNYSVSLTSSNFTIKFGGSDTTSDTVQDGWEIDSVLLRYSGAGSDEDYVDQPSDIDSTSDVGTHNVFADLQASDDSYDNMTEAGGGGTVWLWQEDTSGYSPTSSYETYQFWSSWTTNSTTSGTITKIGIYVFANPGNSPQVKLGIYDDSGGSPSNLLGETNAATITGTGWLDLNIVGGGVNISASTTYHIAHITNIAPTTQWRYLKTATPVSDYRNNRVWPNLFNPAGTTTKSGSYRYGAYRVGYDEPSDYRLELEVQFTGIPDEADSMPVQKLCIEAGTLGSEDILVQWWNGSGWETLWSDLTASSWNNASIAGNLTGSTFTIRFRDGTQSGDTTTADSWFIDSVLIYLENTTSEVNYEIDLEIQWTNVDYTRENEQLCIATGSLGSETLMVYARNASTSSWHWVMNLTASQWNNVSITSYLTSSTFTIQFLGGTEMGDTTPDSWNIDATLLHVWTGESTYDYVDNNTSNVGSPTDRGTHSNFTAQQSGPDSIYDTLTEENMGEGGAIEDYVDNNTSDVDSSTDSGNHSNFENQKAKDSSYDTLTEDGGTKNWGQTSQLGTATNVGPYRYLGGTSPNLQGMTITKVHVYIATAGTIAIGVWTGGALDNPVGATKRTESYDVSVVVGWNEIDVPDYSWPANTVTWIGWTNDGTSQVVYSTSSSDSGDFQSARGRWSQTSPDPANASVSMPSTIGTGSSSNVWYSMYIEYDAPYQMDLEVQFTDVIDFLPTETLCIYAGTLGAEDLNVDFWNGTGWENLATDLTANSWNNYTVSLTSTTFTVRFKDGTTVGDTATQDQWQIDASLLRVEGAGSKEDAVDQQSNVDGPADIGTHSNFTAQQSGPDSINDTLTEENTGVFSNSTLLNDGFEAVDWDANWDAIAHNWQEDNSIVHTGSASALSDYGSSGYFTCDDLNASGASAIYVDFWYRLSNTEADDLVLYYYDGGVYDQIAQIGGGTEGTWLHYTEKITDNQYFIPNFRIRFDGGNDAFEDIWVDDVLVKKEFQSGDNYELDLEVQWTNLQYTLPNEKLCVYGGPMGAEDITVDVWNGTGWEIVFTDLSSGWNNQSITDWLTTSNFTIRFKGGTETGDTNPDTWEIDIALIHVWNEVEDNYELDLEVQWTSASYIQTNEELCIKTGTTGAEEIKVDVWNGSEWINVFTDLTPNSWNNVSVSSYLTSSNFTIRFKGGNETNDTNQDSWNIDVSLLHVWTSEGTYDYVLKVVNQVADNWTVNLQVYDSANIDRLSSLNISLHDGTSSNQIAVSGGSIVKSEGDPYNLPGGVNSTIYISMSNLQATTTGTSYLYVHLKILVPNTSTYMLYVITFEIT